MKTAARACLSIWLMLACLSASNAFAAPAPDTATPDAAPNFLKYLIFSGGLSIEEAQKVLDGLRTGSAADATQGNAVKPVATEKPAETAKPADATVKPAESTASTPPSASTDKPADDKSPQTRLHAVYLPDSEREKIREELKQELLATVRSENWAQPDAVPAWVKKIRFSGDFLLRGQGDYLDAGNDPALNFNAINAGAPVDIFLPSSGTPQKVLTIPYLNTTEDRRALKLRARLSLNTDIDDNWSAGLRLATGATTNPVSASQTLGNDFNKVNFLLDRAWLRYHSWGSLSLSGGRMPSPWLAPTELVWDKDLGLDGVAMQWKPDDTGMVDTFATLGAFAMGNTDANYPSLSPFKSGSRDKWLLGVQAGIRIQSASGFALRTSAAYYDFTHVEGELSPSCYAPTDKVPCETDNSRPGYSQKGNTMFALRLPNRPNPATDPEFQYFGLASAFRVLDVHVGFDIPVQDAVHAQIDVEFARNLAFDSTRINAHNPVNNFAPCPAATPNCAASWTGGNDARQLQVRIGHSKISEAGQWNTAFGYRYVESDALVDGFTDSDFHLGGTNAKGFYAGGGIGIAHNTWVGLKYMSAREVSGWKYSADVVQLDLNARF